MADQTTRVAGGIQYTLTRRQVKNINLRVRADGSVAASASRRVPASAVDAFVASRADWVRSAQDRAAARRREESRTPLPDRDQALARMTALCRQYFPLFAADCPGGILPRITVKEMHSRWGSCSLRTGTLSFSLQLLGTPAAAQEYVVVHEFCHFAHPDHSPAFWAAVARVMPDYRQRRALLRRGG